MAACPPKVVEEKGPCKIRAKNQSSNAIQSHSDIEIKASKSDDVESARKSGIAESKDEPEVSSESNLLSALSVCEFEDLLQEVSKPSLFVKSNCATTHPVVKQLVDGKVIDVKELEDNLNWSSLKTSRLKDRRRLRFDHDGHAGRGGVGCGVGGNGGSAASRTTQGGSLQNLHHGKSSSADGKKLTSLHKSGSLNTFPNSSSYDSDFELAALKSFIATNVPAVNNNNNGSKSLLGTSLTSSAKRNRVPNYGSTCCSAVNTTVNNVSRTCSAESHSSDYSTELTPSSAANALAASEDCLADYSDGFNDKDSVVMMEIDSPTADLNGTDGDKLASMLKSSSTAAVFANGIDERVMEEVDAKVAMPLLYQVKQCPRAELASSNSSYADEWRTAPNSISQLTILNEKSIEAQSNQGRRDPNTCSIPSLLIDTNGNQIQHTAYANPVQYGSFNRPNSVSICSGIGGSLDAESNSSAVSTDSMSRSRKKSKVNSKQKLIEPEKIEGYFGNIENVEEILQRINSTDVEEPPKMYNSVADSKSKKTGNKSKNKALVPAPASSSTKELKKKGDMEAIKVNGTREDGKNGVGGVEMQVVNKKKANLAVDESGNGSSTGSGSQSPELDAMDEKFAASENGAEFMGSSDAKSVRQHNEQLDSSFVRDFYAVPESQLLVEDSEFHEVKKKKKKKQQQRMMYGSSCGGTNSTSSNHSRYQRASDDMENGRNSSSSWAGLSSTSGACGRRGIFSSDDSSVRRKSTSSISPLDHSDNSDVESVHSLPAASTTQKATVTKTSNSSSCTPQASYADIAKMTTTSVIDNNHHKLANSASFTSGLASSGSVSAAFGAAGSVCSESGALESASTPPSQHASNVSALPGSSGSVVLGSLTNASDAVSPPILASEVENVKQRRDVLHGSVELPGGKMSNLSKFEDRSAVKEETEVAEVSVACSVDSVLSDPPGVEFVGGFDWPENLIEVTFGFEVNEQLLQMTESELMASSGFSSASSGQLRNAIYTFPSSDHSFNQPLIDYQGLVISSPIANHSPVVAVVDVQNKPENVTEKEEEEPTTDGQQQLATKRVVKSETIYTKTPNVHHQNTVNYIGGAWLRVSNEIERDFNEALKGRIRYYRKE